MTSWIERVGALHVHSRYSDGSGTVEEIISAARRAGIDHVVLTDHDTMAALREGWRGVHDGVSLLVGVEITPRRQGHLIAMNVQQCLGYAARRNAETLNDIQVDGGWVIIAHPAGKRKISLGIDHAPWEEWRHPVVRGLEIWSYTHDWVDGIEPWRFFEGHEFWRHPERCVAGPYPDILRRWDKLGAVRRLCGWGGLDVHARRIPLTPHKVFPYELMFGFLRNHLFVQPDIFATAPLAALEDALVAGRGFVAHDILADSQGARCSALLPNGDSLQMGEEAPFARGAVMTLAIPVPAEIRWIANGRCRLKENGRRMSARPAGPGVYRFEAWLDSRPWIFTNPFYLR